MSRLAFLGLNDPMEMHSPARAVKKPKAPATFKRVRMLVAPLVIPMSGKTDQSLQFVIPLRLKEDSQVAVRIQKSMSRNKKRRTNTTFTRRDAMR